MNKIKEQTKLKQTQTQRADWWSPEGRGLGRLGKRGEGIKKYKLVVTK